MFQIVDSGDTAITVYLADKPSEHSLSRVLTFAERLKRLLGDRVQDIVPSYCCVTLYFDILRCDYFVLRRTIRELGEALDTEQASRCEGEQAPLITLPVYYGQESAPDMARVSRACELSSNEIIHLHSSQTYRVFALGFRPGFAFMGDVVESIRVPRLESPRKRVPAGSVAIAGNQAAVYPSASPGGWNLIGRCPTPLFSCSSGQPEVLLSVGARVRFQQISRDEYVQLGGCFDE
uniref:5-oxoprolinase subunit PxpB n=1 Tax=Microbulbifer agarilyticus TaxID=260552 RepID=UPI0002558A64|nr:5-oxoprolinase subunit PxpB [Microbulbifer agarilyticus]